MAQYIQDLSAADQITLERVDFPPKMHPNYIPVASTNHVMPNTANTTRFFGHTINQTVFGLTTHPAGWIRRKDLEDFRSLWVRNDFRTPDGGPLNNVRHLHGYFALPSSSQGDGQDVLVVLRGRTFKLCLSFAHSETGVNGATRPASSSGTFNFGSHDIDGILTLCLQRHSAAALPMCMGWSTNSFMRMEWMVFPVRQVDLAQHISIFRDLLVRSAHEAREEADAPEWLVPLAPGQEPPVGELYLHPIMGFPV